MTPTPELKRLAEEAKSVRRDAIGRLDGDDARRIWFRFVDAMTPDQALHLIEENERLRAVCDRVSKLTVAGRDPVTDPVVQKYPLLGELVSAARQALGGQSHDR